MKTDLSLAQAAKKIRASGGFDTLLAALRAYTDEMKNNCIQSPVEMLQINAGRAQACAMVLRVFEDCETIADQAEQRHGRAAQGNR